MNELSINYNKVLAEMEMILHPNIYSAFLKIHNEILAHEIQEAKTFRPSDKWIELKSLIDKMNQSGSAFKSLYMKQIIEKITKLPNEDWC